LTNILTNIKDAAQLRETKMIRIVQHQAETALQVLARARGAQDMAVVAACIRVRQAFLNGQRVDRQDIALVEAFA
jgi:hypothetical protein